MIEQILAIGRTLIDRVIPDIPGRDAAKQELAKMALEGDLKELEVSMQAIITEAKSADPWTSRARPAFMYVMYALILLSVPMGIVSLVRPEAAVHLTEGMQAFWAAIPEELYWLFGSGYLGYSGLRSFDKRTMAKGANGGGR